mgnify:CR=1 FL=1
MLIAGVRPLFRFTHDRLSRTINDSESATLETPLLFVGNNLYRTTMPRAGQRDRLDDGKLSVVITRKAGRAAMLRGMLLSLIGKASPSQLIELDDVTRLRVASRRRDLTVSADGETLHLPLPLEYCNRPKALWVIAQEDEQTEPPDTAG